MELRGQLAEIRRPRAWLYRSVFNLVIKHNRAKGNIVPLDRTLPTRGPAASETLSAPYVQRMESLGSARLALEALDDQSRELIRLKFEEGLSYKEISDRMGMSVINVGYVLSQTLQSVSSGVAP